MNLSVDQDAMADFSRRTGRDLQRILDRLMRKRGIHHAVLMVETGDGRFRWEGAEGSAEGADRRMTPDTPYFIASVTKLYIAAVVLRLAERGLLRLDDSLVEHLPAEITDRLHVLDDVDRTHEITVRHLLAHASGLPDYLEDEPREGPPLVDRVLSGGDRGVPLAEAASVVRNELTPHFPPQDLDSGDRIRVRYSDTNFRLLIGISETILDRPWHAVVRAELLQPLALRRTWAPGGQPIDAGPEPAGLWVGDDLLDAPRFLESLGDLFGTVEDQIRLLRALVDGSAFERPETAKRMSTDWHAFGFDPTTPRLPGWPIEYGLGMMRFELPRWYTPLRRIPPVVGHTGSTGCWLFYCPELDVYICGGVDQATAAAVPFRTVPRVLKACAGNR